MAPATRHQLVTILALAVVASVCAATFTPKHATGAVIACLVLALFIWLGFVLRGTGNGEPLDVDSLMPSPESRPEVVRADYRVDLPAERRIKHPQFILAMKRAFFEDCVHFAEDLNRLEYDSFIDWPQADGALVIAQRNALEPDPGFRQVLPYVVITSRAGDGVLRFFAYQRTSGIGEQRLAGKVSVGIGGHIDWLDVIVDKATQAVKLHDTIMYSAWRELKEEVTVDMDFHAYMTFRPANWFITKKTGVEAMHLAVVFEMPLDDNLDPASVRCRESELQTLGFRTAEELLAAHHLGVTPLENWTLLLLQQQALANTGATRFPVARVRE